MAETVPEFSISARISSESPCEGTATCRKPSPDTSSVTISPAANPIRPIGTVTEPEFVTRPPISAAKPPRPMVTRPAFCTGFDRPSPSKRSRPAMKFSSVVSSVEATKPPPALTAPPCPMNIPLGLTTNTCPVALSRPWIWLVVSPVTRFRIALEVAGWRISTELPWPMENPSQLTTARSLLWSMTICPAAGVEIAALPCATLPPCGSTSSARAISGCKNVRTTSVSSPRRQRPRRSEAEIARNAEPCVIRTIVAFPFGYFEPHAACPVS